MQKIKSKNAPLRTALAILLAGIFIAPAGAEVQPRLTLKEAVQAAVLRSPEVLVRWHAFREADEEIGVARGGFLPRLDLTTGAGRETLTQPGAGIDSKYTRRGTTLSLNQMVFDGFATSSDVKRLGKAKLVRYFELLDASENVALEAARAYLDVVRSRNLVVLAEENYLQHNTALEQLKQRAESGVGRRVDVDQAGSRLALADVNLTTAYANLHDVTARYVRLVGEQPAKVMFAPGELAGALPENVDTALRAALQHNPALRAAIENIEASQYDLEGRRASFMPKLELRARQDNSHNELGVAGKRDQSVVEAVLSYNLFNGGSDIARSRQYRERKNIALDQREKACRDTRQTLSIAYNETLRLNDQLGFIGTQVTLVEKTRAAYRDQFNIGQRTLLDLLNIQNEFFDARRAQVNADIDLSEAYLRSYAGMGRLLEQLGLKRVDEDNTPDAQDLAAVDLAQLCPPTAPSDTTLDRQELGRKAREAQESSRDSIVAGRRPLGLAPAVAAPLAAAPVVAQKTAAASAETELGGRLSAWQAAWTARDVKRYLAFYAPDFTPEAGVDRETWTRQREQRLGKAKSINLEVQNLTLRLRGAEQAVATFRQVYVADGYRDTTEKTLEWRKENGQWLIVRESVRSVAKGE
jgi:outer membrane protein, adhesin transport system